MYTTPAFMLTSYHFARNPIMRQIVTKFGGTSVSTRQNWEHIAAITRSHIQSGLQPLIVCSALTDA